MKAVIALAAVAALLGGAAVASPGDNTTTVCLNVAGQQRPVTCRSQAASRIKQTEDICQCLSGGQPVKIAICPHGVAPPAESAAYEQARYAAVQHGSVLGATYQGQPMCVAPHGAAD
jgi:hypothetical protein